MKLFNKLSGMWFKEGSGFTAHTRNEGTDVHVSAIPYIKHIYSPDPNPNEYHKWIGEETERENWEREMKPPTIPHLQEENNRAAKLFQLTAEIGHLRPYRLTEHDMKMIHAVHQVIRGIVDRQEDEERRGA